MLRRIRDGWETAFEALVFPLVLGLAAGSVAVRNGLPPTRAAVIVGVSVFIFDRALALLLEGNVTASTNGMVRYPKE